MSYYTSIVTITPLYVEAILHQNPHQSLYGLLLEGLLLLSPFEGFRLEGVCGAKRRLEASEASVSVSSWKSARLMDLGVWPMGANM